MHLSGCTPIFPLSHEHLIPRTIIKSSILPGLKDGNLHAVKAQ